MVRVIPFLLVAAVAYWLAAPDPVTAGARTASGTAASAAGAGVRDHWVSGRDSRALTRTNRRDRWSKGGGFWRNLLRLEHGAVITARGVKGAAGITRAAVRPVPAAVRAGWVSGRDRHRAKAGNRPVPVALDPPWWRREQSAPVEEPAPVQPAEQVREQPLEQVQVQDGTSPGTAPEQAAGTDHLDTEEQIRDRRTPTWNRLHPEPLTESDRRFWTARDAGYSGPLDQDGRPGDPEAWPFKSDHHPADITTDAPAGCPGTVRGPDLAHPTWLTAPGGNRDVIYSWIDHPCPNAPTGPDGMCDTHRAEAGTSPAANPTPTEGDPVSSPVSFELRSHVSVEGFARHIDSMSENSDFILVAEKAAVMGDNLRGGGFGREMDTAVDGLGEDARLFAMAVTNLRQAAADWAGMSANVRGA